MRKHIIKFFVAFGSELLSSVMFLFMVLIPLMYMFSELQHSDNIYASALAVILRDAVVADPEHAPMGLLETKASMIGGGLALAIFVAIWRLIVISFQWQPASPNEDQLFEIIHHMRRKNGEREQYCSDLLNHIDEQQKVK